LGTQVSHYFRKNLGTLLGFVSAKIDSYINRQLAALWGVSVLARFQLLARPGSLRF